MHTIKNKQYVHKKSSLYNNAGVSKPKVSPRNTRHEKVVQSQTVVVAVYCYAHAIRTYLWLRTAGAFL